MNRWWWPFGAKNKKQGTVRKYQGAAISRLTDDWIAKGNSMDAEIKSSLKALRNRTRQLARDNDHVRQALRAIRNNVVGSGIGMQAQAKMQRGNKLNTKLNDDIEWAWYEWCKKEQCHVAGKLSLVEIQRLVVDSVYQSGEVLIRKIQRPFGKSKVPFALEIIESDLLDDDYNGLSDSGNEIRMGVELDKWKRPVAYYFFNRHPGDSPLGAYPPEELYPGRVRVPASEIIHLFLSERVGQTRGVPQFASAIMRMHHLSGYTEAEVVRARASASLMGFVESPEGEAPADEVIDGERVSNFEPGKVRYLGPGEKINVPNFNSPGAQFDAFVTSMLRSAAAGIGISYEELTRDYSRTNYSSSRLAILADRDNFRALQTWLIENLLQPIFDEWLELSWYAGALELPSYREQRRQYHAVRWMPRGWNWVDPMKEVQAYKEAVRAGFMTQTDVISQSGSDIEELIVQRKRELDMAADQGIVFDSDPSSDAAKVAASQAEPAVNAPPDDEETATE